ncbi:hypothetical protein PoB_005891700 [Plakobranchus ocellatus]|uniref:Uncharacterized protein n=1 Tax=Plakobranchus ocellatus TaxID=259542 RepID=A0AAV4CKX7_9GAST|nr:hypothetical protein PoB_005891700 [Plakobranchus ocellatus]
MPILRKTEKTTMGNIESEAEVKENGQDFGGVREYVTGQSDFNTLCGKPVLHESIKRAAGLEDSELAFGRRRDLLLRVLTRNWCQAGRGR